MKSRLTLDIPWTDPTTRVVSKGKKVNVEVTLDQIQRCVRAIAANHHLEIHSGQMSPSIREKYTRLKYISSILSHSKHSGVIEQAVREAFAEVPRDQIKPGTLGAWCVGCLIDGDPRSALCCNAMKIGEGIDPWTECRGNVVLAEENGGGYRFKIIKRSSRYPTIAFIEIPHDNFVGFTQSELNWLRSNGFTEGYVNGRRDGVFVELQKFSTLDSLQRRPGSLTGSKSTTRSDSPWLVILLLVLIILIIGVFIIRR